MTNVAAPAHCKAAVSPLAAFDAPTLERHVRATFDRVSSFTIGAEEEFVLVDPFTYEPTPVASDALEFVGDKRVAAELRETQIESVTPICVCVADVERELLSVRRLLSGALDGRAGLLAAGTHPIASDPGELLAGTRYRTIAVDNPVAAQKMLACGLHVHVAVGGADRALAVHNALRSYLPLITAVSANAPFLGGKDAGVASVRPTLLAMLARSGTPPAFASWEDWSRFSVWARDAGFMADPSYQWWMLRLHPAHGTLEVRAADVQTRAGDSAAIVALVQSIVGWLVERFDDGEELPCHPTERIEENSFAAARDGTGGWLADLDTGRRVATAELVADLVQSVAPVARILGCDAELARVEHLVLVNGAERQRLVAERFGLDGLCDWLVHQAAADSLSKFGLDGLLVAA